MNQAKTLVSRYFNSSDEELRIGNIGISEIINEYATPLFVYSAHVLEQKWNLLRDTYPREFDISYSVKANPNPAFLKYFLEKGCGLEIASAGEFWQCLKAGCSPDKMLFAGPGKTEPELELVIARGIGEIHVESIREVERLSAIGQRLGIDVKVAVRINPSAEAQGGAMRMGGTSAPFGIDEENVDEILNRILSDSRIKLIGVHLFTGTQILDHTVLLTQYRKGVEVAKKVSRIANRPITKLDFGGGLGIPYFSNEHELDMNSLGRGLKELVSEIGRESIFDNAQLLIEPGRYLVGDAGLYVTRVIDIKVSRGKKFLVVDGGMHHHLAASGNLGQVMRRSFPVTLLNKLKNDPSESVDVVGPLCTPLDVLARDVSLPAADIGDLVGVFQSGAYARTASPLGFLSHPTPPEVMVQNSDVSLIRRRGTYDDLFGDLP